MPSCADPIFPVNLVVMPELLVPAERVMVAKPYPRGYDLPDSSLRRSIPERNTCIFD